jgi:hypothetical protein
MLKLSARNMQYYAIARGARLSFENAADWG